MKAVRGTIRGLTDLRLTAEERARLAVQGFVASEFRCRRGPYFKLRFRCQGRQQVRYLGKDPQTARQVERELRALQTSFRLQRRLRRLVRHARQRLRQAK